MSSVTGHSKLALGIIQVSILSELLVIASTGEVKTGNLNLRFGMMWLILKATQLGEIIQGASLAGEGRARDLSPREGQCQMFGGKEGTSRGD